MSRATDHFDSALVAVPPESSGQHLIAAALRLLGGSGTLHLLAVLRVGEEESSGTDISRAEQVLEQLASATTQEGLTVQWGVSATMGAPGAEIVAAAERLGVAAIVIGGSNRTRVGKFLMGSDAQSVLLTSSVPVLSVSR